MVTVGGLLPWVKRVSTGPHGFVVETRSHAEITTGLSEEGPATFVREGGDDVAVFNTEGELVDATRWLVAEAAVRTLLRPEDGPLAGCDLHLYLYDADERRLLPVFEPDEGEPSEGWEPGKGATGVAYERGEFVVVTGTHTHDQTYGLSPEQQERYRTLAAVAAMPVLNASDEVIAVLSASTTDPNHRLDTPDGFDELLATAAAVSRVLIDLLGWGQD